MKKIGSVNSVILASLQDCKGCVIGYTIDTPNAIAYAMAINSNVAKAVASYQYFGESVTTREKVQDRFEWVIKESDIYAKFLTWL